MWYPKDLATWLALIALILVVPFNFFSSWAYPKLQNWWAARSRKSLQTRIEKLTESLAAMGRGMSVTEEWVLVCAEQLGRLIYWGVNVVLLTIALFVIPLLRPVIHHRSTFAFIVSMYVIGYKFFKDYVMFRITFSRRLAGPLTKMELEESIEDLTAKLAARKHRNHGANP